MFECNKIDNAPEQSTVPVEIALTDGAVVKGRLSVAAGKTLIDILNGSGAFVEFEPYGGERQYLAKSRIDSVKPVGVPRGQCLRQRSRLDDFDPYQILGIAPGADWEAIRQAYLQLSKVYHPDRYANAVLPEEVRDYLSVMVRRINAAYAALEAPRPAAKQAGRWVSTPIYTSQPRA
ncbi:MAG TPA: J domain-containing protein [Hyphomicrobiaceae bacterium]|nr:J domain-containing protein [Hyphomicrobiaceae bacterium]